MRTRLVAPAIERLTMSEGDWIEIKRELTVGEEREMYISTRRPREADPGEPIVYDYDPALLPRARAEAYLLRWSLTDEAGAALEITREHLDRLEPEAFEEISQAIERHRAAITEEKKRRRTENASLAIS